MTDLPSQNTSTRPTKNTIHHQMCMYTNYKAQPFKLNHCPRNKLYAKRTLNIIKKVH